MKTSRGEDDDEYIKKINKKTDLELHEVQSIRMDAPPRRQPDFYS